MELPRQQPSEAVQIPVGEWLNIYGAKPIRGIASRVYTVVILSISLALLEAVRDRTTIANAPTPSTTDHKPRTIAIGSLASQKFVFIAILIGSACNLVQLGMVIYCVKSTTGKAMARSKYRIFFDYYTDKVVSLMLAVTVGAGLGSSIDLNQLHVLKDVGGFFSKQKISTALMATVLLSTSISYSCSEEALKEYRESLDKGEEAAGVFRSWATRIYNFFGIKFNS